MNMCLSPESWSPESWRHFVPHELVGQGKVKDLEPKKANTASDGPTFVQRYRKLDSRGNKFDYYLTAKGDVYFQQLSASGKRNLPPVPSPLSKIGTAGVISWQPNYEESESLEKLIPVLTFTPLPKF